MGSCVAILPSHTTRQVHGSECRDFGFDTCVVTALLDMFCVRVLCKQGASGYKILSTGDLT